MWLGITEYLFRKPELLAECIDTAIVDNTFRADDLEFTFAARVSFPSPILSFHLFNEVRGLCTDHPEGLELSRQSRPLRRLPREV
jgi:hypothetical protein